MLLDIGAVIWAQVNAELGVSFSDLNNAYAANTAGLAVGCVLFIPFALKYGRRPVYLLSTATQFAGAIWQAKVRTTWEIIASNALCGVCGAVSETIVQMTVADLFFLHQRATANGVYLAVAALGAWLAPVAAGYCAVAQGWRWIWWWLAIILGISLVAMIFLYEETKYAVELALPGAAEPDIPSMSNKNGTTTTNSLMSAASREEQQQPRRMTKKSYWKRLALVTKTDEPFGRHVYRPFVILFTFPAVMYTALIYGLLLAWLSVISTVQSTYLPYPPYNFSAAGVGLFNLPPLIGAIVGSGLGGPLNGRWALWMAQRNRGVFEPEMRLWLSFPAIIACPAGILLFGLGLAEVGLT